MEWIASNWLAIVVAAFIIGFMLYGHYVGFLRMAISIGALIIAIILSRAALPYVTDFLRSNQTIEKIVTSSLTNVSGINNIKNDDIKSADKQDIAIDNLALPKQMKQLLKNNNDINTWKMLGVDKFTDYLSNYLSNILINIIGFVIIFIIIWLVLKLLIRIGDIITKIPIIHGLNQIAGAILGLAQGFIYIWIACMILTAFIATPIGSNIIKQIESNAWLSYIYNHNLISSMFNSIIYGIWSIK